MLRPLAAAALALVAPLATAHAQTDLRLGQVVQGRLDTTDPRHADGTHYDEYVFRSTADQTVTLTLQAPEFDAYLRATTGSTRGAAIDAELNDDDSHPGDGLDARLVVELRAGQTLVVHATSLTEATGAYTLSLDAGALEVETYDFDGDEGPYTPDPVVLTDTRATDLAVGQTMSGTLGSGGPSYQADTTVAYRLYRLTAGAGETVTLDVRADFDTILQLGTLDGATFTAAAYNDDTDGTNPQIVHRVEGAAPVYVLVTGFMGGTGDFTIQTRAGDHAYVAPDPNAPLIVDLARVQTSAIGADARGALTDEDLQGAFVYDVYRIRAATAGPVTLHVASEGDDAFDPFLAVGTLDGATFTAELTDDDSGPGLEPVLMVTMGAGEERAVIVRSFGGGAGGAYTLHVREGDVRSEYPDDPEQVYGTPLDFSSATDLAVGRAVDGRLSATSPVETTDGDEAAAGEGEYPPRHYVLYRFRPASTGAYTVTLRSNDENQGLELGRNVGGLYVVDNSDDDSGVGRDAALVSELHSDSTYFVRVIHYGEGTGFGGFRLQARAGDLSSEVMESMLPDEVDVARATALRLDQEVAGELAAGDAIDLPWDSETDVYLYTAEAGETLVIDVTKVGDPDPYVEFGSLRGNVFTVLASDDDSGGDLSSRLEVTVTESGRYAIRVSAINEVMGAYRIRITRR